VYRGVFQDRAVAVAKLNREALNPKAVAEIQTELKFMTTIVHANIITFLGAVTQGPELTLVTELAPKGSLLEVMHRSQDKTWKEFKFRMMHDVVQGVAYIHSHGFAHRDLKPGNVLVMDDYTCKIADFGTSTPSTGSAHATVAGTYVYMAPEILRSEQYLPQAADVYSLGMLLWEVAMEEPPFSDFSGPLQVVWQVGQAKRRPSLEAVAAPLSGLIQRMWDDDKDRRPDIVEVEGAMASLGRPRGRSSHKALYSYPTDTESKRVVVARHDYTPSVSGRLELHVGDKVSVHCGDIDGWWLGQISQPAQSNVRRGWFPANFVVWGTQQDDQLWSGKAG